MVGRFEIAARRDPGVCADVPAWLRDLERARPDLLREAASEPETTPVQPVPAGTMAETMRRVKTGEMSVEQAVAAHMTARASAPMAGGPAYVQPAANLIDLMTRAKAGDATARAGLDRYMKRAL